MFWKFWKFVNTDFFSSRVCFNSSLMRSKEKYQLCLEKRSSVHDKQKHSHSWNTAGSFSQRVTQGGWKIGPVRWTEHRVRCLQSWWCFNMHEDGVEQGEQWAVENGFLICMQAPKYIVSVVTYDRGPGRCRAGPGPGSDLQWVGPWAWQQSNSSFQVK